MQLNINLASQPYEDSRQFWTYWGAGIGLLALVTTLLVFLAVNGFIEGSRDRQQMAKLKTQLAEFDREKSQAQAMLNQPQNRTVRDQDPTAHAEVLAIRAAATALGRWRLDDCALVVTLEPCAMCAGAIVLARLAHVAFGAWDDKAGMVGSVSDLLRHPRLNHRPEVHAGVLSDECGALLRDFFGARRGVGDALGVLGTDESAR